MTMFSMKPKFDLAEFLAQKPTKPTQRRRYTAAPAPRAEPDAEDSEETASGSATE